MLMLPVRRRSAVRAASPRPARPSLTEIAFCAWVAAAEPGDRVEYHRGFLAVDVVPVLSVLAEAERTSLMRLAAQAYRAAEIDFVRLIQRRHGHADFSYFAVARPRAKGVLPAFALLTLTEEAA